MSINTMRRSIVKIDEEKCDGCGLCVSACHEGALQIIDGKAKLVRDDYCDGLGACLGECPQGAILIEEREAAAFDEAAVEQHLKQTTEPKVHGGCPSAQARIIERNPAPAQASPCGCPSAQARSIDRPAACPSVASETVDYESALQNWPTQLMLAPPQAQYLQGADLLISADCVPFAYAGFHSDLLPGKVVVQACPKLDDTDFYTQKLAAMFAANDINTITVARMEVPCCGGLVAVVKSALRASGKDIPVEIITVGIAGEVLERQSL